MEKLFRLQEHGTTVKTEITAGITTFLSMVYILAVNPLILSGAKMNPAAVFTATCIASAVATLIMALWANYPIALSSGMGLNVYFANEVCGKLAEAGVQEPWKIALTAVLVEGAIFILLSLVKFRETLVNEVPKNLKLGITVGIGLFITFIGFMGAGVVVKDSNTAVNIGDLSSPSAVLALCGLIIIGILHHYNVKGAILFGILITWILGMGAEIIGWYQVNPDMEKFSLFPKMGGNLVPAAPHLFEFNFEYIAKNFVNFAVIVFSFLFVDLFDTVGTLIGVAKKGELLDSEGKLPRVGRALMADAVGTCMGACLGTSTVTSYVESSAGVAQGGKTGLTSATTGVLFIFALVLSPIFLAIPAFAVTPALVFVGLLMMGAIKEMDFEDDMAGVVGGFLAIVMMPFTYSIANGIMFGILSFVVIRVFQGKAAKVHPVIWVSALLFVIKIGIMIHEAKVAAGK